MRSSAPTITPVRHAACREKLLKAARALFLLQGLDAATVDVICMAASVSKGAFYYHFRSKEDVFLLVALEELGRELELVVRPAPGTGSANALLLDLWSWAPRHPHACRRVRSIHRKALRRLAAPSEAGVQRGGPAGADREAPAMLALILGTGRIARRALASQTFGGERQQKRAAAG